MYSRTFKLYEFPRGSLTYTSDDLAWYPTLVEFRSSESPESQ